MTVYLLAGGGTAGHVNPLLALAEYIGLSEPQAEIIALGTEEGLESRLVPERGIELQTIARLPFPRRPGTYALKFPAQYRRAVRQVRELIRSRRVDVVVGFGGYASSPAYRAAQLERVPYVIHEANARPGLANRLGARKTPYVAVTFVGTPLPNARVTGTPLRKEIASLNRKAARTAAREFFDLDANKPTLLVTGGSQGARAINLGISAAARDITAAGAQVLHIWGGLTEVKDPGIAGYRVIPYCDRMDLAFAACDLTVSRAGSATVSELAGLGIPAILIPYSTGNGEQRLNAAGVVNAGGAILVRDEDLTQDWNQKTLLPLLLDDARLQRMSEAARTSGVLDGTQRMYELVSEAIRAGCDTRR